MIPLPDHVGCPYYCDVQRSTRALERAQSVIDGQRDTIRRLQEEIERLRHESLGHLEGARTLRAECESLAAVVLRLASRREE